MLNLTEIKKTMDERDFISIKMAASLITEVEKLREVLGVAKACLKWYSNDKNWNEDGVAVDYYRQPNTVDGPGETIEEADMGCRAEEALNKIDEVLRDK